MLNGKKVIYEKCSPGTTLPWSGDIILYYPSTLWAPSTVLYPLPKKKVAESVNQSPPSFSCYGEVEQRM